MYGFISGISDTDDINYCPKCGGEKLSLHGNGTAVCLDCGFAFAVVETRTNFNQFIYGRQNGKFSGSKKKKRRIKR